MQLIFQVKFWSYISLTINIVEYTSTFSKGGLASFWFASVSISTDCLFSEMRFYYKSH